MKKFLLMIIAFTISTNFNFASGATDKYSEAYLKGKKHFSLLTPLAETATSIIIKSTLKSEAKGKYKVKCSAYNLSSLKKGILKNIEVYGKNVYLETVKIPILNVKTVTNYNRIDYTQNPIVIKSDIILDYYTEINENTLKQIIETEKYKEQIKKVNYILSPLITIENINISLINNKIRLDIAYNFPLTKRKSSQICSVTSKIKVFNNKLHLFSDETDKSYTEYKLAKIINLLDPFNFSSDFLNENKCNIKVEHVNIIDNIIRINGRIFIESDEDIKNRKGQ